MYEETLPLAIKATTERGPPQLSFYPKQVTLWDGCPILLGVFEPFQTENKEHKILAFLTARVMDPAGRPVRKIQEARADGQ